MFDLVNETFYQMPFPIQPAVVFAGLVRSLMRWNDRFHTLGKHQLHKGLGCIASVSQQMVEIETVNQRLSLVMS